MSTCFALLNTVVASSCMFTSVTSWKNKWYWTEVLGKYIVHSVMNVLSTTLHNLVFDWHLDGSKGEGLYSSLLTLELLDWIIIRLRLHHNKDFLPLNFIFIKLCFSSSGCGVFLNLSGSLVRKIFLNFNIPVIEF